MLKKIYLLIIINLTLILSNCSPLRNVYTLHGQIDLFDKSEKLILNYSNKNDIIKILGETTVKDPIENKIWYYSEVVQLTSIYGKKKTLKNNLLVVKFDDNGVLKNKKFYNIDELNNLDFDSAKTESLGVNNSIIKSILKSSKKRIENQSKKLDK